MGRPRGYKATKVHLLLCCRGEQEVVDLSSGLLPVGLGVCSGTWRYLTKQTPDRMDNHNFSSEARSTVWHYQPCQWNVGMMYENPGKMGQTALLFERECGND